jgi:myo-inositol-1(or 4)-monophosphatase
METTHIPTLEMLDFARRLADAARGETLGRWANGCAAEDKGGTAFDPVTEADREAERAMRAMIEAEYPDHGIAGEEFPERPAQGPFTWSLDPIDGTRAFLFGLPTWVTLIALLDEGRPVLGIIDVPRLDERYLGHAGGSLLAIGGAESAITVSGRTRLSEAHLTTTDPTLFDPKELEGFSAIRDRCRLTRYGLDGYGYARLAAGTIDLVIESGLKPHDYNALIPVVRGAGGVAGDWRGGEDFSDGKIIAAASRELYEEAVRLLS